MDKTVLLDERIDSTNSESVEKRIRDELGEFKKDNLILDASKTTYISSAGLRIILRLKKENNNTKVINCNSEIYDIFQTTGFTEMMEIEKAYRIIDITNCEMIGSGANGTVYRIDNDTIVKVYKNPNALDEIRLERELARKAFVMGIPTAIPYDVVKVDNTYGSVFELLDAKSFNKLIKSGYDLEKLAKESVDILNIMHNTFLKENELPYKNDEAIKWAKFDLDYLDEKTGKRLLELFEAIPKTLNLIHGDYHIKNIMKAKDENLLIDMDTLSVGHPIFEFAAIYASYIGYGCVNKGIPSMFFDIKDSECKKFYDLTMKYYFKDKDQKFINDVEEKAKIICYARILRRQIKHYGIDDPTQKDAIDFCINYLKENVFKVDKLYY